jgi:hypothetical protein
MNPISVKNLAQKIKISNTVSKYNVSILVVSSPLFLNKLKWFNKQVFFHLQQLNSDSQNYAPLWKTRCRSCNTFSRSESGAETRSQTFQILLDILNQNQVVEQVSTDI